MAIGVKLEAKGKSLRVFLRGRLDEAGVQTLANFLLESRLSTCKDLRFDCRELEYIGSSGIGALISYHRSMTQKGGRARLENLSPDIHRLFQSLKLDHVLTISPAP